MGCKNHPDGHGDLQSGRAGATGCHIPIPRIEHL